MSYETKNIVVIIDSWQIQCCGKPFAVGDKVEWIVEKFGKVSLDSGDIIDYIYEHHSSEWKKLFKMVGIVTQIKAKYYKIENPPEEKKGTPEYICKSIYKEAIEIQETDGFEKNRRGLEFRDYEVYLKDCAIRPAHKSEITFE